MLSTHLKFYTNTQPIVIHANQVLQFRSLSHVLSSSSHFSRVLSANALKLTTSGRESLPGSMDPLLEHNANISSIPKKNDETSFDRNGTNLFYYSTEQVPNYNGDSMEGISDKEIKEMQRRMRIGKANKGKTPWNKGKKHSAETREFIRKRTIEAMRHPKVRERLSQGFRGHSEESKARIGLALRRIWQERSRRKTLQNKCCLEWQQSIAEEARKGGHGQEELNWDSFEKLKEDIIRQQLQWAAEKEKAKKISIIRNEKMAKAKAEKMAMVVLVRQLREDRKAKARAEMKEAAEMRLMKKVNAEAISKELRLKVKLTKMHQKKLLGVESMSLESVVNGSETVAKKWDLDFIKREKMQRSVSLADQIRAAKNRKAKSVVHHPDDSFLNVSIEERLQT
ncbi:uncharacterized protein LOC18445921 [Amborella trichopoda]|nr:uncharacterized protein LOC18445921 [Amborella trichopoda]|eukprot:XP_006856109.2 uncharacterized protein LOC18445921 [Amborella trichopoda]